MEVNQGSYDKLHVKIACAAYVDRIKYVNPAYGGNDSWRTRSTCSGVAGGEQKGQVVTGHADIRAIHCIIVGSSIYAGRVGVQCTLNIIVSFNCVSL